MKVRTKGRIVEGDAGKVICCEAERLKPGAVIMGTRGRTLFKRCLSFFKFPHTLDSITTVKYKQNRSVGQKIFFLLFLF